MNKERDVIKIWFGLRALFSNFLKEVSKGFLTPHPVKTQKFQQGTTMKEMDRNILAIDKKVDKTATVEADYDLEYLPTNIPISNV